MSSNIIGGVKFTHTEAKVLSCFAAHIVKSKLIGSILGSAPKTIDTHIDNIKRKINANNKDDVLIFIKKCPEISQLKIKFNSHYIDHKF